MYNTTVLHENIINLHMNKLHANQRRIFVSDVNIHVITLHGDIIYVACKRQKCATIIMLTLSICILKSLVVHVTKIAPNKTAIC